MCLVCVDRVVVSFILIYCILQLGAAYTGSTVGGPDGGSQHSLATRHSSMLVGSQEADVGGYRPHTSTAAHYGGQYSSVYGSAALSGAQQVSGLLLKYIYVCACVCFSLPCLTSQRLNKTSSQPFYLSVALSWSHLSASKEFIICFIQLSYDIDAQAMMLRSKFSMMKTLICLMTLMPHEFLLTICFQ